MTPKYPLVFLLGLALLFGGAHPAPAGAPPARAVATVETPALPGLVSPGWLAKNLARPDVRVLDMRPTPDYNGGHIPGALCVHVESLRGNIGGLPSMLLPTRVLAMHLSLMGLKPTDTVVIVSGAQPLDATLPGMAFERMGHRRYAVLSGGMPAWDAENLPKDQRLPKSGEWTYPARQSADNFTVSAARVLAAVKAKDAVILDVRTRDLFSGEKREEARGGHIPGAVNRPFAEDLVTEGGVTRFRPVEELARAYAAIIPSKDARVIVHCRTGREASQTWFVLKRLLGYRNVLYYDAGWTEWAARPELPVETGSGLRVERLRGRALQGA